MLTFDYIAGLASCVFMVILGIALRITIKNDLGVTILSMTSIILGVVWGFVFLGMPMGW